VRYYVEAIKADTWSTASYYPSGAEHAGFLYQVQPTRRIGNVVINELMASNSATAADATGAFPDWVELYNKGDESVDLSGYFLSDDGSNLDKWIIPDGTSINADSYLIIWADSDEDQTTADELHASFKLSAGGESVVLSTSSLEIIDQIDYDVQQTDIGYARIPNGTGDFSFRTPTFAANNDGSMSDVNEEAGLTYKIYPNPTRGILYVAQDGDNNTISNLSIQNAQGQVIVNQTLSANQQQSSIDLNNMTAGLYTITLYNSGGDSQTSRFVILK